ncbi:MAG TPA: alpha/beta hydrolase [Idiomarina sp.]|jgi:esterase|uniref:alpha/beta fold hydrolase n=1 Tax=Idiomarina baltica TaxID=190892 RepID=UPI000C443059|nr:alpha/beta fold hydrolase [Idiomarina baltica]MAF75083.1 alpha/beta hydrolase [Idiomarinaceae bacterium]MBR37640.1 alpha/beta hydrolase [Idiomarina sp.]MEC8925137.1 alpha/beta fold hydrolase [Pseudomonadota bacterium]MBL73363.1 alpha/beta hydrolase [Idiomarinaceae bacterium]HAE90027.1 alpha/beta hydrolase [Idiomarina sp.]|tara:strand:+ start:1934 stop:2722 length:789 start_codon:yes stop_codon:yes gene_type:complete
MAESELLHYETMGDKQNPAVIIIHGLFGDGDNLKSLARDLERDYFCVLPDARNHGDSPHHDSMTYTEMADDIVALADALALKKFSLVGHSMGGKIAMEVAMRYEERVQAAVFADIAPVAYPAHHNTILDALAGLDLHQITSRTDADKQLSSVIKEKGVRQFLLKNLRKDGDHFAWRLNLTAITERYDDIAGSVSDGDYSGPCLFIKGGNSDYLTEQHKSQVTERFSNSQVKVVENTGHWLHAEKPRIFNRLVKDFLASHGRL